MSNTIQMARKLYSVDDATLVYRNFRGEARMYNNEGDRNFNLVLSAEKAAELAEAGFRIKEKPSLDEFEEPRRMMIVKVSYRFRAPKVVVISGANRYELDEDTIGELDYADIEHVDLTIRPSYWHRPDGSSGVTAYLNSMYVTLTEDPYAEKYAASESSEDIPF